MSNRIFAKDPGEFVTGNSWQIKIRRIEIIMLIGDCSVRTVYPNRICVVSVEGCAVEIVLEPLLICVGERLYHPIERDSVFDQCLKRFAVAFHELVKRAAPVSQTLFGDVLEFESVVGAKSKRTGQEAGHDQR